MKITKAFWLASVVALFVSVGVNVMLMVPVVQNVSKLIEPPQDVVIEASSIFWTFRTREIDSLIRNLKEKNQAIELRESKILGLEERLVAERNELTAVRETIAKERDDLLERLMEVEEAEQKNLKTLAATYTAMSPESVVVIFKEMEDVLVVKILSNMGSDTVGPIFQAMSESNSGSGASAERAARLSELLRLSLVK